MIVYNLARVRLLSAFLAFITLGCDRTVDYLGSTYEEMVSDHGAPCQTRGAVSVNGTGACVWAMWGFPNETKAHTGMKREGEQVCGELVAFFKAGHVVKWTLTINGKTTTKGSYE